MTHQKHTQHHAHHITPKNHKYWLIIGIIVVALIGLSGYAYYNTSWNITNIYTPNERISCGHSNRWDAISTVPAISTTPVISPTVTVANSDNISVDYADNGIVPSVINLQAGKKYTITMTINRDPRGCMYSILLQWLDEREQTIQRGTTLTFNVDARTPGTYRFVCGSMGMGYWAQVVIE